MRQPKPQPDSQHAHHHALAQEQRQHLPLAGPQRLEDPDLPRFLNNKSYLAVDDPKAATIMMKNRR